MALYSDTIRRWAVDLRRAGVLAAADGIGEVGLGEEEAGRRLAVRFALRVRDGRAEAVRFQVFGCGFTVAACAAAAELAEGRELAKMDAITASAIDAALDGLPPERGYCATLAAEALQAAVQSAGNGHHPVTAIIAEDADHAPRVTVTDPVYRALLDSPAPAEIAAEDRHLFACLLAVAAAETDNLAAALGLNEMELDNLTACYFPGVKPETLTLRKGPPPNPPDPELQTLLCSWLPVDKDGGSPAPSLWLARILASRASLPGHLWRAMGLFARPELTAAIDRHLPALAEANSQGMRWKRFFFKELCARGGGTMCKSPECGVCSDYALCFGK